MIRSTFTKPLSSCCSRLTRTYVGILLLAVLIAGVAVAPHRLAAQEATPAVRTQATEAQTAASSAEKPKTQEEQDNAFLYEGPIVKWTARTFHLPVETASKIFQIANFLIIALLLGVPLVRVMPKIFHKRSQTLGHSLKTAREATADANARLSAVETKLAGLDEEIKKFKAQVEQESLEDEVRIKASLAEESTRIVQAAEQELNVAAAQAQRGLRHFAADLAIEQAAKQMTLSPETDKALIAEFVGQVAGKGGQN